MTQLYILFPSLPIAFHLNSCFSNSLQNHITLISSHGFCHGFCCFNHHFPSYFRHISIIFPCPHHGSGAVRNPCLEGVGAAPRFGSGESVESVVFALRCSSKRGMLIEKKRYDQYCPFGKNRRAGLVYHLSSTNQWEKDIYGYDILP